MWRDRSVSPAGRSRRVLPGWIVGDARRTWRAIRWAVQLLAVPRSDRIIELGCGPGMVIAALATRTSRGLAVGVDPSQVMISHARRRNSIAVRAGRVRMVDAPVERPSIRDGSFDAARAGNTLGMWPDPTARLREFAGRLRPGVAMTLGFASRRPA
ncbi:class I SAM-dependent methyltransferase [Amycolatopsis palatopharyngis]|uniref:class I SAM-dependent methyltransferase n=1 Tax=Amycolatopsis palatopharyngis TaxID=187982 RepID=UPI003CCC75CC